MRNFIIYVIGLILIVGLSASNGFAQTSYKDDCSPTYRQVKQGSEKIPKYCTNLRQVTVTKYYIRVAVMSSILGSRFSIGEHTRSCRGFAPGLRRVPAYRGSGLDPLALEFIVTKFVYSRSEAEVLLKRMHRAGYKKARIFSISESYYEYY